VPIDRSDHLDGVIDPESGQGAFGYEYHGNIPRERWIPTKLDLLYAQEVGYTLRRTRPSNRSGLRPRTRSRPPRSRRHTQLRFAPKEASRFIAGKLPPASFLLVSHSIRSQAR
jgi:hypothetical protein